MQANSSINSLENFGKVWAYGAIRGTIVNLILYPTEVIKTNQQASSTSVKSYEVFKKLVKSHGLSSLYSGCSAQIGKTILRQGWWWPMIIYLPPVLEKQGVSTLGQQVLTGIGVGTIDTIFTTPLDKLRVLRSTQNHQNVTPSVLLKEGWKGAAAYWQRQSITWASLLYGQKYFRKSQQSKNEQGRLHFLSILDVSTRLSLIASLAITPFDSKNTRTQSEGFSSPSSSKMVPQQRKPVLERVKMLYRSFSIDSRNIKKDENVVFANTTLQLRKPLIDRLKLIYRGLPINFATMLIQTTATVFLIDRLEPTSTAYVQR